MPQGHAFAQAAQVLCQGATTALEQVAAAAGGQLLASSAVATHSCVQVGWCSSDGWWRGPLVQPATACPQTCLPTCPLRLAAPQVVVTTTLAPAPGGHALASPAGELAAEVLAAAQQQVQQGLPPEARTQMQLLAVPLPGDAPDLMVRPVCLVCPGGSAAAGRWGAALAPEGPQRCAATDGTAGLMPVVVDILSQAAELAEGRVVQVLLDDLACSSRAGPALASPLTATVVVAASGARQLLLHIPPRQQPGALLLHVLPGKPFQQHCASASSNAGAGAGAGADEPPLQLLASLPLLCLPPEAAQEARQLHARMADQVEPGGLGRAAGDGGAQQLAAMAAYSLHYVPWALDLAWLLAPAARPGPEPAADSATAEQARELLLFLELQGMRACLQLVAQALQHRRRLAAEVLRRLEAELGTTQEERRGSAVSRWLLGRIELGRAGEALGLLPHLLGLRASVTPAAAAATAAAVAAPQALLQRLGQLLFPPTGSAEGAAGSTAGAPGRHEQTT